ncbi:hypothetical protein BDQ17DRAFT_1517332 [Cyathus striatus]|nr:hypothetical protein BDQ17DRAFT_1517332 [Cyathus striatus]
MHKHARSCWGDDNVKLAMEMKNADDTRRALQECKDSSIAAAFCIKGKGKLTYSHRQHTHAETCIVNDHRFKVLMKTG